MGRKVSPVLGLMREIKEVLASRAPGRMGGGVRGAARHGSVTQYRGQKSAAFVIKDWGLLSLYEL